MKNKVCCWILLIGAICVFGMILISGALFMAMLQRSGGRVAVREGTFLLINTSGRIAEHDPSPQSELLGLRNRNTLGRMLRAIDNAAKDPKIAGVILRPTGTGGWADLRELREALRNFKTARKPVYAYLELATDRDYYLASIADTIVMQPAKSSGLVMLGLGVSSTYLARTFEKVGLKFSVLHAGEYKGAYENLAQDRMSDPLRESLQFLLDDLFQTYVDEIAADRPRLARDTLENELLHGRKYLIPGEEAVSKTLADLAADWDSLKRIVSPDREFQSVTVPEYLRSVTVQSEGKRKIAVVFAEGEISYTTERDGPPSMDAEIDSDEMVGLLEDLRKDDQVAAVVVRVNSPGGSALASDIILAELRRLKAKKPVVVSMGNVAASGGYYISCAADRVIAQPNTVTGSIGVVGVVLTGEGLYKKIAAREETVEHGKWANFFRFDQDLGPEQKAVLKELMGEVYEEFVGHVADGRGLTVDEVKAVAEGRIWTGKQALERQLVDELGGLGTAIERARELAKIPATEKVRIRYYPREKDLLRFLIDRLSSTLLALRDGWFTMSGDPDLARAIHYLDRFVRNREFVQTRAPLSVEF